MSAESTIVPLGNLVKIKGGKRLPKGSNLQEEPNSHPYIRVRDMGERFIPNNGLEYVPDSVFPNIQRYTVEENDVIISIVGTIGLVSVIDRRFHQASQTENCAKMSGLDQIDALYIYYYLSSSLGQQKIKEGTVGAVQAKLPLYNIEKIPIIWPKRRERESIVDILGSLDDKIELNRQINQTLEEMAQAIFKSWFVDFELVKAKTSAKANGQDPERAAMCAISGKTDAELDHLPPDQLAHLRATAALFPDELTDSELGPIPEGWEWSTIGKEVEVVGGGTPSTKVNAFWDDGIYNWTTPKDLSGVQEKILLDTERKITKAGLEKISSGLLPVNTVLLSSRAPVGYLALAKRPVAINQGYIAMKCDDRLPPEYVLQWAESVMDEIKQRASGTTFAEISKKNFREIPVLVPNSTLVSGFQKLTSAIYEKIKESMEESKYLAEIRDSLLPKLLSGEIELTGVEDERS